MTLSATIRTTFFGRNAARTRPQDTTAALCRAAARFVHDHPGYGDALFDETFLLSNVQLFEEGMVSAEALATAYVAQLGDGISATARPHVVARWTPVAAEFLRALRPEFGT